MKIKIYQVDAFTSKVFKGNSAAVCPLDKWIDEDLMQKIAMENNLAETAFYVKKNDIFEIRWFTPKAEIDLAGHPTLATSFVIFEILQYDRNEIHFHSMHSGDLFVRKENDLFVMNFPSRKPERIESFEKLDKGLKIKPLEVLKSRDILAIFKNEQEILAVQPDFSILAECSTHGVIISARGNNCDFVSRFFAPKLGINEDPVTGSAHATLIPYWAEKLNKNELHAFQLSERTGELFCKNLGDRVEIAGKAVLFMEGEIILNE